MSKRIDEAAHARFLPILRHVKSHAGFRFRHERCPHRREDFIAEAIAWAWRQFTRLEARGKDATSFKTTLAKFAVLSVKNGEGVCGNESARDAMSEIAHQRHEFKSLTGSPLEEAVIDNAQTPVPDQVQFRVDFPAWLTRHTRRDQQMIIELAKGERIMLIAKSYRLSASRVGHLRTELRKAWEQFCEEPAEAA